MIGETHFKSGTHQCENRFVTNFAHVILRNNKLLGIENDFFNVKVSNSELVN